MTAGTAYGRKIEMRLKPLAARRGESSSSAKSSARTIIVGTSSSP